MITFLNKSNITPTIEDDAHRLFSLLSRRYQQRLSDLFQDKTKAPYVVGATKAEYLKEIRKIIPEHFFLVPGVGAQGGSLEEVCKYGLNDHYGLLINSSRGIIYASKGEDFAKVAGEKAEELQQKMKLMLKSGK